MAISQSTIDTIKSWYTDRAPDAEGLNYWAKEYETKGADFAKTAFGNSANAVKASENLYTGLLGREGDKAGVGYWATEIASGKPVDQVTNAFKDSARTVYQDYLTNPNSANRSNSEIKGLIDRDLNAGVTPGTLSGDAREVAKTGISKPIFENLYGKEPEKKVPQTGVATLDLNTLDRRTINPSTETVRGQLDSLLAEDSPYLQQARARAQRVLAGRGLINSTMAGTAGEDAAISAALNIATPDASTYKSAGDYNTALLNQARMYNADELNKDRSQQSQQDAQMAIARLQDSTNRYTSELSANTTRYQTDQQYRRQMDANRDAIVQQLLVASPDLMSPDRKAAILEQLGMGTSAKRGPNGEVIPGTGLAGAVYVIDSVAADLAPTQTPTPSTFTPTFEGGS